MAADTRLGDVLLELAISLCSRLGGDACAISRVVGDVLILVAEHAPQRSLQLGQGYLVPDYPRTRDVLRERTPYQMTLNDPGADTAEADVVRELGFGALLMLPLEVRDATWGLVEVYRTEPTPFDEDDLNTADELIAATAALIP